MKENYTRIVIILLIFSSFGISGKSQTKDLENYNRIKWKFKTNGPVHGSPVLTENKIIIGSGDSSLYAFNKNSGALLWKFKTQGTVYSTPSVSGNFIYFTSMDGKLYALNIKDGSLSWSFRAAKDTQKDIWDYHNCSPLISENTVYFGDAKGTFYALNKINGTKQWSFQTNGIIHTKPLIYKETICFGNFEGYFYGLNKNTGEEKWKFKTTGQRWFPEGAIQQGASLKGNTLYFGSRDFNIYALNAETGRGVWNMYEQGSWVIATPTIKDTIVLFGTSDSHHFYALDSYSGKIIWKKKLNMNVFGPCETGNRLAYFGALNGIMYAVDLQNGETVWEFQTDESKKNWNKIFDKNNKIKTSFIEEHQQDVSGFYNEIYSLGSIVSKPVLEDKTLYFTSMNGFIYAIE